MSRTLSVVIPVFNSADYLRLCLEALARSTTAPLEVIVVDDGSTDSSADVARAFGATLIAAGCRRGPAHARNLGAKYAKGDLLFFIDADVCVHPDSLARILANFDDDPGLAALIGSYDETPQSKDFLSLYKNLMHCYVHQAAQREACTFWSGCGAMRREIFLEHSGFDESYKRPAIEDIELGYRLIRAGHRIALDRELQVKHLKRWTFWNLVKTDVLDRGIPWTELILRDRSMPNDLNVQVSQRISVALVFILFACALEGAIRYGGYFLTPVLGMLFFVLGRYWVEGASRPKGVRVNAMMAGLVLLFFALAYKHNMLTMFPPVLLGYALLLLRQRYGTDNGRRERTTGLVYGVYSAITLIFISTFLPTSIYVLAFYLIVMVIVILNNQFFFFMGSRFGGLCALTVIPFNLLYHFYNGISFGVGLIRHTWRGIFARHPRVLQPKTDAPPPLR